MSVTCTNVVLIVISTIRLGSQKGLVSGGVESLKVFSVVDVV